MAVEASKTSTMVIEESLVTPQQPNAEQTLPFTFFDILCIHSPPIHRLLFYKFPCPKSNFLQTIVPSFKESLSKTLKHYPPLSGNFYFPNPTHSADSEIMPEIRYKPGDSVSLIVAEYSGEVSAQEYFDHLVGNFPRDCDKFCDFRRELPDPRLEDGFQIIPVFAVQITLFPGAGICIGFTNHHVVGDASSIVGFIKAWSRAAANSGGEISAQAGDWLPPIYDRSMVKDPNDVRKTLWNSKKHQSLQPRPSIPLMGKVRATFVLQGFHLQNFKQSVRAQNPNLTHLSSFTVATAYAWTCLAKARSSPEQVRDDEEEHFGFAVEARARVDPPLPPNYFGNCLGGAFLKTTPAALTGRDGFITAAELISDVIGREVAPRGAIVRDVEDWLRKLSDLAGKRFLSVVGSPKFDLYGVDFGWGRPKKFESLSVAGEGLMSLSMSGEFHGGLEIGLALTKEKMEAFAEYFYGGLE